MKLSSTLVLILAGGTLALAQDAGQPASRPSADSIQQQIKNLDDDSYEIRTKAMDSLRAAGEDARKDLETARTSPSLEVRTRADTLLKELDARKAGVNPQTGLRPLSPEEELPAAQRGRNVAPRFEDFQEPKAFVEALRKWMEDGNKGRFPDFVLPPDSNRDFGQDFTIIEPDLWTGTQSGGSMIVTSHKDGETVTYKSGPEGVTLNVQKKNEAGETVIESYQAKDADELRKNHPDVWEKYQPLAGGGVTSIFRSGGARTLPGRRGLPPQVPAPPPIQTLTLPRMFGVMAGPVPPVLDSQLKLKGEGVVIESVSPGSTAERFGVRTHDVLLRLDGEIIRSTADIIRVMSAKETAPASAKVVREGAVLDLTPAK